MPYKRRLAGSVGRTLVKRRRLAYRASRFAGRRALMYGGYVGAAAALGYGAYKGIRRIKRARARRIQRRRIGDRMGYRPKTSGSSLNPTAYGTNTLVRAYIDDIGEGEDPNQRQYNSINLKGFRMNLNWRNEMDFPIRVCCAVISPKTAGTQESPTITQDFFRAYGIERGGPFPVPGQGIAYDDWVNTPINADKYVILHRWDFSLGAKHGEDHQVYGKSIKAMQKWVPIKRRINYDAQNNDTPQHGRIMLCWWAVRFMATTTTGVESNAVTHSYKIVTYFSDTK